MLKTDNEDLEKVHVPENLNAETQDLQRTPRKSGVVIPNAPRWYQRLGAAVIVALARMLMVTFRYRWNGNHPLFPDGNASGPVIYCTWHNRLALCMKAYGHVRALYGATGLAALVSASKDGGFLAAILERFGVQPVRGSSSRRGPQALLELTTWAERGYDLAITPDGPRGPRYVVQDGVISLAQITGLTIIPFGFHASRKIQLKSWDGFQIPLPFALCQMNYGTPIRVPRDATDAQRQVLKAELEKSLKEISPD